MTQAGEILKVEGAARGTGGGTDAALEVTMKGTLRRVGHFKTFKGTVDCSV